MDSMIEKTLSLALEKGQKVRIIYNGEKGCSERTVKVLGIDGEKADCYCYLRRRRRSFLLDRILSAVLI